MTWALAVSSARARLQEDLDDHLSVERGGFDVLDVIDQRSQRLLVGRGEAAFQLFGLRPV